jgi:hypothetical protein
LREFLLREFLLWEFLLWEFLLWEFLLWEFLLWGFLLWGFLLWGFLLWGFLLWERRPRRDRAAMVDDQRAHRGEAAAPTGRRSHRPVLTLGRRSHWSRSQKAHTRARSGSCTSSQRHTGRNLALCDNAGAVASPVMARPGVSDPAGLTADPPLLPPRRLRPGLDSRVNFTLARPRAGFSGTDFPSLNRHARRKSLHKELRIHVV